MKCEKVLPAIPDDISCTVRAERCRWTFAAATEFSCKLRESAATGKSRRPLMQRPRRMLPWDLRSGKRERPNKLRANFPRPATSDTVQSTPVRPPSPSVAMTDVRAQTHLVAPVDGIVEALLVLHKRQQVGNSQGHRALIDHTDLQAIE